MNSTPATDINRYHVKRVVALYRLHEGVATLSKPLSGMYGPIISIEKFSLLNATLTKPDA